jgi:predicted O-methyltransferase YrrM
MTNTLDSVPVRAVLDRMFAAAARQEAEPWPWPAGFCLADATAQERADALDTAYLPISAQGGNLLYALVRAGRPDSIVEFGTSFGISTIYLAAAVTDNGRGHVLSTELSPTKVAAAQANLAEAGLAHAVTVLSGDARQTLVDLPGRVDLLFLDGWKDLCLPVLLLLEDRLSPGSLVLADDTTLPTMSRYLDYVHDPTNGYVNVAFPVEDGIQISCRT